MRDIIRAILVLRGQRLLLDTDRAALDGVGTKVEWAALRSQIVTSKASRGGRRYARYAFTEQGVAMFSSVHKQCTR
jgi:hypothetical protein